MINKPDNIILECHVGSKLYGMNTPDSDVDICGVYIIDLNNFFTNNVKELVDCSIIDKDENDKNTNKAVDCKYYELGKFIHLCNKGSPNIIEMLFSPEYTVLTEFGQYILDHRHYFMDYKLIKTFGGFIKECLKRADKYLYYTSGNTTQDWKNRKKEIYHAYRLNKELYYITNERRIKYPFEKYDIREFKYIMDDKDKCNLKIYVENIEKNLEEYKKMYELKLPNPTCNQEMIDKLLIEIYSRFYRLEK